MITTYNVLSTEFARAQRENKIRSESDTNLAVPPLQQVYWHRIVLDEAHSIKESATTQAKAAFALLGDCRWCLTYAWSPFIDSLL